MLTPNRKGLSALPADLFYSQVIDVNYQNGLVWSRNPQFRFIVHPTEKIAMDCPWKIPSSTLEVPAAAAWSLCLRRLRPLIPSS